MADKKIKGTYDRSIKVSEAQIQKLRSAGTRDAAIKKYGSDPAMQEALNRFYSKSVVAAKKKQFNITTTSKSSASVKGTPGPIKNGTAFKNSTTTRTATSKRKPMSQSGTSVDMWKNADKYIAQNPAAVAQMKRNNEAAQKRYDKAGIGTKIAVEGAQMLGMGIGGVARGGAKLAAKVAAKKAGQKVGLKATVKAAAKNATGVQRAGNIRKDAVTINKAMNKKVAAKKAAATKRKNAGVKKAAATRAANKAAKNGNI